MDVTFETRLHSCMEPVLREIHTSEQTQQISLPDGMPDIGQVLGAWGQPLLRGKQWQAEEVSCNGGLMVWVLYAPEDGSPARCLEGWIPFTLRWDLPQGKPEGSLRLNCLCRFVDARVVSARKLVVRGGLGVQVEAFCPMEAASWEPEQVPPDVQLLRRECPVRLPKEMTEKSFSLDEELTLPESAPALQELVYYRLIPSVTDKKVLSGKAVFRGNAQVHVLYRSTEGQLHNWDFSLPFSQYAQLEQEHSPEAQADLVILPTSLELELEDGRLRLKAGLAAQVLITDREKLNLVADAYSPTRELTLEHQSVKMPVLSENRRHSISLRQELPVQGNLAADVCIWPDFPRQRRPEEDLALSAAVQVLYYGEDGSLQGASGRWEGTLPASDQAQVLGVPGISEDAQVQLGTTLTVSQEMALETTGFSWQELSMVAGIALGEPRRPDPDRPSLILCRMGQEPLWELAKESLSTVEAIRLANGLTEDPTPNQMLLIPVV